MEESKTRGKGKSGFFSAAIVESVLALLLIAGILVLKFFFKQQYIGIKKWYTENVLIDTSISEMIEEAKDEI